MTSHPTLGGKAVEGNLPLSLPPLPAVSLAVFFARARSAGPGTASPLSLVFFTWFLQSEWVSG